jgi:membrane protease YdiL (CAAX protease family)
VSYLLIAILIVFLPIPQWGSDSTSPLGQFTLYLVSGIVALAITVFFSRAVAWNDFKTYFGFCQTDSKDVMRSAVIGAGISFVAFICIRAGFAKSAQSRLLQAMVQSGDTRLSYFHLLLLLVPFGEEVVMRGYLYRAFRQGYSIVASIACILGISSFTHLTAMSSSWAAALALLSLNALLCLIRERTNSLWNCIICHLAYNVVCIIL